MAYEAGDGFKSTNRAPMMAHKRSLERKSMAGGVAKADPLAPPAEQQGGESPEAVAQAHGPAQEVHVMHQHEAGQHSVHSVHPDGHEHHSEHGSAEEAHEHGKKLAGVGGMEHGEPDGDEAEFE